MRISKFILTATILSLMPYISNAKENAPELHYYSLSELPKLGTLAQDASAPYTRLPDSLKNVAREAVWNLGQNSAGIAIRFRSDASNINVRWTSTNTSYMNHMAATGSRGLDLYVLGEDSVWTTLGSARPNTRSTRTDAEIMRDMEPKMREYMLYLSLYNGVDSLEIGIDKNAQLLPPTVNLPRRERPIVMYGTSILQGGCASRPGMAHTNIIMRDLQHEVINLGFSGNALLDPEIARLMAQADASLFVLDPLPNCSAELVAQKMEKFIGIIRSAHPETPILLVESPVFPSTRFNTKNRKVVEAKNRTLKSIYTRLKETDRHLHYFEGAHVLCGNDEATVDNTHFTDFGFSIYAHAIEPVIRLLSE